MSYGTFLHQWGDIIVVIFQNTQLWWMRFCTYAMPVHACVNCFSWQRNATQGI
jgi:hypothetical protein